MLNRALERQSDDPALLMQLGRLRLRTGAAAQALEVFARLLAAAPRNADALDGQGVAFDLLGRHAEAERSHRAALALAPGSLRTANNLAVSLLLAGRAGEAAAVLEPLSHLSNAPPRVAANLAIARAASGDREAERSLADGAGGSGAVDQMLEALSASTEAEAAGHS